MRSNMKKFVKENKWLFIGIFGASLFVYSSYFFDHYNLSFLNIMYSFSPFDSMKIATKGPILSDVADHMYPVAYKYLHNLDFTYWMSSLGIGTTQSMSLYMYVLNYFYLLPFGVAIALISYSKFLIGFLGMYFFAREYGVKKVPAAIGAISYTFSAALVMWHGWPHSDVAMLAPFLFLFMEKFLKKLDIKYLFLVIIFLYLMLVAGMPTFAAYFLYLLGMYVLFYGIKNYRKEPKKLLFFFGGFGVSVLFAILLSLPYTGELLNSVGSNGYAASRKGQSSEVLSSDFLQTLIYPYIRSNTMTMHLNESTLFSGLFAILLLPFSFLNYKKKKNSLFWLTSIGILLLLIFTNLLTPIYSHLPMINTSLKYRVIVLLNFAFAINLAITLNDFFINQDYYKKNKIKALIAGYFSFIILLIAFKKVGLFSSLTGTQQSEVISSILLFITLFLMLFLLIKSKNPKILAVVSFVLCTASIYDSGNFAKEYLPFVSKQVSAVPKKTDTINFLQKNTQNNEKVVALGSWTFFPSTNMFYNLRDIRGHDFIYTNQDVQNYYEGIESDAYDSATRVSFSKIENTNLLKYMGVKYVVSPKANLVDDSYTGKELEPVGPIYTGTGIEQEIEAEQNDWNNIEFVAANYQHKFTNESMTLQIIDIDSGQVVVNKKTPLSKIKDNQVLNISFAPIENSKGKKYKIVITSDNSEQLPFTLYKAAVSLYANDFIYNAEKVEGNLVVYLNYKDNAYKGKDKLGVHQYQNYSPQLQLINNIEIKKNSESVLSSMKQSYKKNTLFLDEEQARKIKNAKSLSKEKIAANEKITVIQDEDNGQVTLSVKTNTKRFLLMNEYNDGNWQAYVNGKKVQMYKGNYLFRAIEVPKGESKVKLVYAPTKVKLFIKIALSALILLIVLFIIKKRIQNWLINYCKSK